MPSSHKSIVVNLILEVTEEDIEEGKHHAGEYHLCPVAVSLKKLGFTNIDADEDRILLTSGPERYVFKTPRLVNHFISDFDHGREVKPFKCSLEIPRIVMEEDERKPLFRRELDYLK